MPGMPATTQGPDRHGSRSNLSAPTAALPERPLVGDRVDGGAVASVSFAQSDGTATGSSSRPSPSTSGHEGHALVAVGPGITGSMLLAGPIGRLGMNPLPIQPAKIHPPLLRHDVLSRERLNGWLDGAAGGRVALVIAEAGFGKTTFLADWARHTRRATAWYRLEPDDRDWLAFIRHLVASGREIDPGFAPETYDLLAALGPGGPSRDDLITSVAQEMAELASSLPSGLSLLFDDYHAVDGSPETEPVMKALVERTGPGFSLVIASRTAPSLALGRLRARGARLADRRRRPLFRRPRDGAPLPGRLPPAPGRGRRGGPDRPDGRLGRAPVTGAHEPGRSSGQRGTWPGPKPFGRGR